MREAVFRGDALIVDGMTDQRNNDLDDLTGVKFKGKPPQPNSILLTASFLPAGSITYSGNPLRFDLITGVKEAAFGTASGDPAIIGNSVGLGKTLHFAFDLVGTLQTQATSSLLRAVLDQSVGYVTPAASATVTGDAFVPLTVTVQNPGISSQTFDVVASIPAGFTVLESGPVPNAQTSTQLTWRTIVPGGQQAQFDWALRAPSTSGSHTVTVQVNRIDTTTNPATSTPVYTGSIALTVAALAQSGSQAVSALQALSLTNTQEKKARDDAVAALQDALAKTGSGLFDAAIAGYLSAGGFLDKIGSIPVAPYRVAIDRLIQETGRKACQSAAACAISTATPTGYNVTVFGSASMVNGQSSGSVGVGGALSMNSFAAATNLFGDTAKVNVGGSLSFNSGSVGQNGSGVINAGGSANVGQSVGRRDLRTGVVTEDWTAMKTSYLALADRLALHAGTAAVGNNGNSSNQYTCSGSDPAWNVCTLAGARLSQVRNLIFNYPPGASVLVNVTGTEATLTNGQATFNGQPLVNGAAARQVIFNFPQATGVTFTGFGIGGTVLAPRAEFTLTDAAIDGSLIANKLTSKGSFSCNGTYQGSLPSGL